MNNKKLYYILKSVWMVVILLVALILMNRDFTDISAKKQKEEQDVRLNIALINEDAGVSKDNKSYSLGADYVKKIEKDATYNWFTVSRGVGENGLKNGTYNLLVTIPSNFSSKLLELDSTNPEQVQVNYKVNANGNATLENESNNVGRKIVNGLNQQLVDMYVVSIMDNLFTAQKNIEKVYTNQTESVNGFQNILYQPTIDFKQYLPSITAQSKSALQANDLLTTALTTYTEGTDSLVTSHKDYSTVLEELLKQRAEGKLTYEDFIKILTSMDDSLLSSETNQLYQTLDSKNNYLQEQFNSGDVEGNYTALIAQLNQQLADSKKEIEKQKEKLDGLKDQYFETYKDQFFQAFKLDPATTDKVTLEQALKQQSGNSGIQLATIPRFNKAYSDWINERIGLLPYVGPATLPDDYDKIFNYPYVPYGPLNPVVDDLNPLLTNINDKIAGINAKITTINDTNTANGSPNADVPLLTVPNDSEVAKLTPNYKALSRAYDQLMNKHLALFSSGRDHGSFRIDLSAADYKDAKLTFTVPAGVAEVTIDGTSYPYNNDASEVYDIKYRSTQVSYRYEESYDETATAPIVPITITMTETTTPPPVTPAQVVVTPETVTPSTTESAVATEAENDEASSDSQATEETKTSESAAQPAATEAEPKISTYATVDRTVTWNQTLDVSMFLSADYQQAKRKYSEEIGKVVSLYESVLSELTIYDRYPIETMNNLLNTDMTTVFKDVIETVFFAKDGDYAKQTEQLNALITQANSIEQQSGQLSKQLEVIQQNTGELNETVTQQLPLLKEWQETMSKMTGAEGNVDSSNQETDTELSSANTTLQSLLSQTESIKASSDMNAKEAESVKSVFSSFDKEVANAQKNGEDLSQNADVIMNNLNKELANNNDFVSAFIKVLNNAHQDGVPNNTLMQFIANPVGGKAETTIKTTEVNEPFTWILIMYTLSLFVAYLFATQPVTKKIRDSFKKENLRIKNNLLETILLSVSSLVIGVVVGILSIGELSIVKESQIVWMMMVVLFTLLFSLLNHYLIKQFRVAGFGLSLFLFISYIFVTNAIGKTKGNNPLVQIISDLNPLSIGETNLADILARNSLNILQIIWYLLLLVGLVLFNIFIWKPKRKAKEVVTK